MKNFKTMEDVQEKFSNSSLREKLVVIFWCICILVIILSGIEVPAG
jgi:hypothetical protein